MPVPPTLIERVVRQTLFGQREHLRGVPTGRAHDEDVAETVFVIPVRVGEVRERLGRGASGPALLLARPPAEIGDRLIFRLLWGAIK